MILLWGLPSDEPMAAVREVLREMAAVVAFLDQRLVLETQVEITVSDVVEGRLRVRDDEIDLREVRAVYLRPYESLRMPAVQRTTPGSVEVGHALSVEDVLTSWLDVTPAYVVNRPTAMASNTSKPFQAALIQEHGFAIPATLLTTDTQAVADFVAEHGQVIYKSVSSTRSIVRRLDPNDSDRLGDVTWCPTQFQQYLAGQDFRVHIVGEEVFACAIDSAADDYRYAARDDKAANLRPAELPEDVAGKCRKVAAALNLPVAGIDLRRTSDDTWYCFEVNPAPGFSYFQGATGQPIDRAIARLLVAADGCTSWPWP